MTSLRVLFLPCYPRTNASARYRVYMYADYLKAQGFEVQVYPLFSDRHLNRYVEFVSTPTVPFRYKVGMACLWGIWLLARLAHIVRATLADVVFIQSGLYITGGPFLESLLHRINARIVYDFDDALYIRLGEQARLGARWVDPDKIAKIIHLSAHTIVSNTYLAEYAQRYSPCVSVVPTSVDLERYQPRPEHYSDEVVIGWVGNPGNLIHLKLVEEPLAQVITRRPQTRVRVISSHPFVSTILPTEFKLWTLDNEVADLRKFDIGIMPLIDNDYTRGKAAFKAVQYMGVAVPVVCSPVGMNVRIIENGKNGFLAANAVEWIDKVMALIDNPDLRRQLGTAGRQTVAEHYSLQVNGPKVKEILRNVGKEACPV